ncbi:3D domain-containing protein [Bacillus massilinigeriensis]|uniref:3D domain-containing protein n=1 Tax=Bacillus massilionigeriensis TaxID=1805475 RepID=UPI00096B1132|nr:3D domain-containing protein [Bacillus massilionigeriensis]
MKKALLAILAAATITSSFAASAQAQEITVKKGDTLSGISKKYHVSVSDLKKWNQLKSDKIIIGKKLEVSPAKRYIVKSGDTISGIAKKYHVSTASIKKWNKLKSDKIVIGQKLVINSSTNISSPVSKAATKSSAKKSTQTKKTKEITVTATAYTAKCKGCSGVTATGFNLKKNPKAKVISVDPKVIPLGSKVYVEGYGYARAEDTGGAIKGKKIDVFVSSQKKALKWGRKKVRIKIID